MSTAVAMPRGRTEGKRPGQYPDYRATGLDWLPAIPQHWSMEKLKYIAQVQFSNVDKKSEEGEVSVRLCNYVDVYYHDRITSEIEFMEATADPREIAKFQVQPGDVLATKDSEDPNDICVPAVVGEPLPGVLCGYHLAQVRPLPGISCGGYIMRAFASCGVRDQFRKRANGITRFGLSQDAVCSALIPVPPVDEQEAIAEWLEDRTKRIDELVAAKRRLIDLWAEQRTALITRAVTKGLNPRAAMKPSGVEWLGDVPAHWTVERLRFVFQNLNSRRIPLSSEDRSYREKVYPYYGASGIIDAVDEYLFDEPLLLVAEDGANLLSRSTPLAFIADGKYWVNNHAHILRPRRGPIRYWECVLQSFDFTPLVSGSAQPKLTIESLSDLPLPMPPVEEQAQIIAHIASRCDGPHGLDSLVKAAETVIARLKEYRQVLITAAVTGKIDVRLTAEVA